MENASPAQLVAGLHAFGLARDRFRSAMSGVLGLGLTDIDALEYLEEFGPMTQRELGRHLQLTSGAVTMLVDRLVAHDLACREPHPTDRRALLVRMAPEASLPDVPEIAAYHVALARAAEGMSVAQRAGAARFLHEAATEAQTAAGKMRERH